MVKTIGRERSSASGLLAPLMQEPDKGESQENPAREKAGQDARANYTSCPDTGTVVTGPHMRCRLLPNDPARLRFRPLPGGAGIG